MFLIMLEEVLYDNNYHSRMDYSVYGLHESIPKHLYITTGYELRIYNPSRYSELSELLGIEITNSEPFTISCEDYKKFSKFVSDPTRHYIGIRGDK